MRKAEKLGPQSTADFLRENIPSFERESHHKNIQQKCYEQQRIKMGNTTQFNSIKMRAQSQKQEVNQVQETVIERIQGQQKRTFQRKVERVTQFNSFQLKLILQIQCHQLTDGINNKELNQSVETVNNQPLKARLMITPYSPKHIFNKVDNTWNRLYEKNSKYLSLLYGDKIIKKELNSIAEFDLTVDRQKYVDELRSKTFQFQRSHQIESLQKKHLLQMEQNTSSQGFESRLLSSRGLSERITSLSIPRRQQSNQRSESMGFVIEQMTAQDMIANPTLYQHIAKRAPFVKKNQSHESVKIQQITEPNINKIQQVDRKKIVSYLSRDDSKEFDYFSQEMEDLCDKLKQKDFIKKGFPRIQPELQQSNENK